MGAYTDFIQVDGTAIYALVKKDDYATTRSTGGIVEHIYWVLPRTEVGAPTNYFEPWKNDYDWDSGNYEVIDITESENTVKPGWILQDKTRVLRDPNS